MTVGLTFPLKVQFSGDFYSFSYNENIDSNTSTTAELTINQNYEELRHGIVKVFGNKSNGFKKEIKDFSYKFDGINKLYIEFDNISVLSDFSSFTVDVSTGSTQSTGYSIETPVYLNQISAIPSILDDTYDICNYLDDVYTSIETVTKLSNVSDLKLKVVSSDPTKAGNAVLKFYCGNTVFTQTIPVSSSENFVNIAIPNNLNGLLTIERLYQDTNDTLNDSVNNIVITLIITDIVVETK